MKPVTDVAVIVIKYLDNPKINTNYIDLSLRNPMLNIMKIAEAVTEI